MSPVCPGAGQRTAFTLVSAFIVWLLLVTAASAGWPDLNGDWSVNLKDFAIFANAWRGTMGSSDWSRLCDIAPTHGDRVIDEQDLNVICDDWLAELPTDLNTPGATLQVVYTLSNKFFEGATWDPNSNKLFFTNMTSKQILRLDSPGNPGSAYTWMNNAILTNGMFLGIDGRLLTADQSMYRVRSHRIGASGALDTQVLPTTSDPPNDLCQLSNGNIYMTCQNGPTSSHQGVYLYKGGTPTKVNNNSIIQPNGIIASLDETLLYVSESSTNYDSTKRWWVFPINSDGTLGTGSIFFQPTDLTGMRYADPDGMTIDERGNLYLTGMGGFWIVSPTGQELMRFPIAQQTNNMTFGGTDYTTLYITCAEKVYSLAMEVHGGE